MSEDRQRQDNVLKAITRLNSHFEEDGVIPLIKTQVEKTNGRVTKLEKFMWTVMGSIAILSIITTGILIPLSRDYIKKDTDLNQRISNVLSTYDWEEVK